MFKLIKSLKSVELLKILFTFGKRIKLEMYPHNIVLICDFVYISLCHTLVDVFGNIIKYIIEMINLTDFFETLIIMK